MTRHTSGLVRGLGALALLLGAGAPPLPATVPQVSFKGPRDLAAVVQALKRAATSHPAITELLEIGKSAKGQPLHVLVVGNRKTGTPLDTLLTLRHPRAEAKNVPPMRPDQAKPGQWIDGGFQGPGPGSEACLHVLQQLLTGYGKDPDITQLLDTCSFYLCPVPNPDGPKGGPSQDANWPEGWWKDDATPGGVGSYPTSLPEVHALIEFFTQHTNIAMVQSAGGPGTATLRPFARWAEDRLNARDKAVYDQVLGKKFIEMTGGTADTAWRHGYQDARKSPSGHGTFLDWAQAQFGAYATSTQVSEEAGSKALDTFWHFERFKASLLPHAQVKEVKARVISTSTHPEAQATRQGDTVTLKATGKGVKTRIVEVKATFINTGALPTHQAAGAQLRGNREDVAWLLGDRDRMTFLEGSAWVKLGVLAGSQTLPEAPATAGPPPPGRPGGTGGPGGRQRPEGPSVVQNGKTPTVTWLVALEGDVPLKVVVSSQKGGTHIHTVTIAE